jgi:hypothetical protein
LTRATARHRVRFQKFDILAVSCVPFAKLGSERAARVTV